MLREGDGAVPAYTALVRHPGNQPLYAALELSTLALLKGYPLHVHTEGLRGTGKTTIIRAARELLPRMLRIRGCLYNCDPRAPHCPQHRHLGPAEVLRCGVEEVPVPFLEVSPSAKLGTVVGSIDLGRLADRDRPEAALLPGTLAQAHRGIVFVDEVNRLADVAPELADAFLDVMGTKPGRLQIEETGLPRVVISSRVTVWAASNPDEEPGPLADVRRQLADRFDLVVAMNRPSEPAQVAWVLARDEFSLADREGPPPDAVPGARRTPRHLRRGATPGPVGERPARPAGGALAVRAGEQRARRDLRALRRGLRAAAVLPAPAVGPDLRALLGQVFCDFQLESLRAVQAWQAAARLEALRRREAQVGVDHLRAVAAMALRHRTDPEELARLLAFLERDEPVAERGSLAGAAARAVEAESPDGGSAGAQEPAGSRPWGWQDVLARLRGSAGGRQLTGGCQGGAPPAAGGHAGPAGATGAAAGTTVPRQGLGLRPPVAGRIPRLADPMSLPPFAPRHPARRLAELDPAAWVARGQGEGVLWRAGADQVGCEGGAGDGA